MRGNDAPRDEPPWRQRRGEERGRRDEFPGGAQSLELPAPRSDVTMSSSAVSLPTDGTRDASSLTSVVADMSMSLDGFVADSDDAVDRVFAWYAKPQPPRSSAGASDRDAAPLGVIVYGRRTFDVAHGWGWHHPLGVPVIVVTHETPAGWPRPGSTVSFANNGIQAAIDHAKTIADGRTIALGSPSITQQCLDLGLVDRLQISLVPVLLGRGIRYLENLATTPNRAPGPRRRRGQRRHPSLLPAPLTRIQQPALRPTKSAASTPRPATPSQAVPKRIVIRDEDKPSGPNCRVARMSSLARDPPLRRMPDFMAPSRGTSSHSCSADRGLSRGGRIRVRRRERKMECPSQARHGGCRGYGCRRVCRWRGRSAMALPPNIYGVGR